jgi:hypothetical protein
MIRRERVRRILVALVILLLTPSLTFAGSFSISVGPQRELFRGWIQYKGLR